MHSDLIGRRKDLLKAIIYVGNGTTYSSKNIQGNSTCEELYKIEHTHEQGVHLPTVRKKWLITNLAPSRCQWNCLPHCSACQPSWRPHLQHHHWLHHQHQHCLGSQEEHGQPEALHSRQTRHVAAVGIEVAHAAAVDTEMLQAAVSSWNPNSAGGGSPSSALCLLSASVWRLWSLSLLSLLVIITNGALRKLLPPKTSLSRHQYQHKW